MSELSDDEKAAQARRHFSLVLQVGGMFDVGLGLALAFLGPRVFGGDPTVDMVLMGVGAFLVLMGIGLWWFGRTRNASSASDGSAQTVVRSRR